MKLDKIKTGLKDYNQATYRKVDILLIHLLMPLFDVYSPVDYLCSWLARQFQACSSTLYRFKNDAMVNWRSICTQVYNRLNEYVARQGVDNPDSPRCIIIDDTYLPKTGKFIEHIGKIWSHTIGRSILGFKGLFVGYWDSKTFQCIDFSLHKELGKNQKQPYGLPKNVLRRQYSKYRDDNTPGYKRESELHESKIDNAKEMLKRAIKNHIKFDYLLIDSWFMCDTLIKFVLDCKANILGMCKMGKTKYLYCNKELSAADILKRLRRKSKLKWYKRLGLYSLQCEVEIKGTKIKLFFCRNTRRGKWHMLLTTDTSLTLERAYEYYSIRWSVEVFFKEAKQYFGLTDCQSQDFDGQIADISKVVMHYNIFSVMKRFTDYETLGELFREIKGQTTELTLCMRIWSFLLEILSNIADIFEIEPEILISQVLEDDGKKQKILTMFSKDTSLAA